MDPIRFQSVTHDALNSIPAKRDLARSPACELRNQELRIRNEERDRQFGLQFFISQFVLKTRWSVRCRLVSVVGSPAIAAFFSHAAFWGLLVYGWAWTHLKPTRIAVFLILWFAGRIGLPYVPYEPAHAMFSSFVAVLDIALVFVIFGGDVRLT